MNIDQIAELILSNNKEFFLISTSLASDLDARVGIKDDRTGLPFFERMYSFPNPEIKRTTTLLNALFTQKKQTFMMTRDYCIKLMKEDVNHKLSLGNDGYSKWMAQISDNNNQFFKTLRPPTGSKAGVYQLILPSLVKELHRLAAEDYYKAEEKAILEFYESNESISDNTDVKPSKLSSAQDIIAKTNARLASKDIK
jgi:hypothetical protein